MVADLWFALALMEVVDLTACLRQVLSLSLPKQNNQLVWLGLQMVYLKRELIRLDRRESLRLVCQQKEEEHLEVLKTQKKVAAGGEETQSRP